MLMLRKIRRERGTYGKLICLGTIIKMPSNPSRKLSRKLKKRKALSVFLKMTMRDLLPTKKPPASLKTPTNSSFSNLVDKHKILRLRLRMTTRGEYTWFLVPSCLHSTNPDDGPSVAARLTRRKTASTRLSFPSAHRTSLVNEGSCLSLRRLENFPFAWYKLQVYLRHQTLSGPETQDGLIHHRVNPWQIPKNDVDALPIPQM